MNVLKFKLFTSIILSILLDSQYTENPLPGYRISNPENQETVKCITIEHGYSYDVQTKVKGPINLNSKEKVPIVNYILTGTEFTYECCGNKDANSIRIYKFGLYKEGHASPSSLICRVEVDNNGLCSFSWNNEFSVLQNSGRMKVEYNRGKRCALWTIRNVTKEDENTYVAIIKDNFDFGKGFDNCQPIFLNVSVDTPTSPTNYSAQDLSTDVYTDKEKPLPTRTTNMIKTHETSSTSNAVIWWKIFLIVVAVLAIAILVTMVVIFKSKAKSFIMKVVCICQTKDDIGLAADEDFQCSNDSFLSGETNI